jgi:hypothetical protein
MVQQVVVVDLLEVMAASGGMSGGSVHMRR